MARRRTSLVYHVQSKRLTSEQMVAFMILMWAGRMALYLLVATAIGIGLGCWWMWNKFQEWRAS